MIQLKYTTYTKTTTIIQGGFTMVKVITVNNYKGGVGKSTTTELISYILSTKYNYKVLAVDLDPQGDLSRKLKNTFNKSDVLPETSLLTAITEMNIKQARVQLHPNLDIIHGTHDMKYFEKFIYRTQPERAEFYYFKDLFPQIINEYDFVIFDTTPKEGVSLQNAVCISDYMIITTDTTESSMVNSKYVYDYIGSLTEHNPNIRLIGVLLYFVNVKGSTSIQVKAEYDEIFKEDMYTNFIKRSDRVERWDKFGIKEADFHDNNTMQMYLNITDETIERMKELEG